MQPKVMHHNEVYLACSSPISGMVRKNGDREAANLVLKQMRVLLSLEPQDAGYRLSDEMALTLSKTKTVPFLIEESPSLFSRNKLIRDLFCSAIPQP